MNLRCRSSLMAIKQGIELAVLLLCDDRDPGMHHWVLPERCYRITPQELEELFYISKVKKTDVCVL